MTERREKRRLQLGAVARDFRLRDLIGAMPNLGGEVTRHQTDEQQREQRNPVLRVGNHQRAGRGRKKKLNEKNAINDVATATRQLDTAATTTTIRRNEGATMVGSVTSSAHANSAVSAVMPRAAAPKATAVSQRWKKALLSERSHSRRAGPVYCDAVMTQRPVWGLEPGAPAARQRDGQNEADRRRQHREGDHQHGGNDERRQERDGAPDVPHDFTLCRPGITKP